MPKIPLTRAEQCYPFTEYLSNAGVPVSRTLEQFRIPVKMLESKDLFVDESRMWRWVDYVNRKQGFPDLGFEVGSSVELTHLGSFGEQLLTQPSLFRAIEICTKIIAAESVVCAIKLDQRNDYSWLTVTHLPGAPPIHETMVLYDLMLMLKIVRTALGDSWLPPAVELNLSGLPRGIRADSLSTGPVRMFKPSPALAIPEELLALPMHRFPLQWPANTDASWIKHLPHAPTPDFATSLCWLVKGYLDENLTVCKAAELVGMSRRTLQRRLFEAGMSFTQLLDQARFETARELLSTDSEIPITEVAHDLGYESLSNFSRAFKRWSGVSPRQFRMSRFSSE